MGAWPGGGGRTHGAVVSVPRLHKTLNFLLFFLVTFHYIIKSYKVKKERERKENKKGSSWQQCLPLGEQHIIHHPKRDTSEGNREAVNHHAWLAATGSHSAHGGHGDVLSTQGPQARTQLAGARARGQHGETGLLVTPSLSP